jgi:hypothetical protein
MFCFRLLALTSEILKLAELLAGIIPGNKPLNVHTEMAWSPISIPPIVSNARQITCRRGNFLECCFWTIARIQRPQLIQLLELGVEML